MEALVVISLITFGCAGILAGIVHWTDNFPNNIILVLAGVVSLVVAVALF